MEIERVTIEENEKFLRQISKDVNFNTDPYLEWIEKLKDYCNQHKVYSLTPVQIGIPVNIIYLKNTTENMQNNEGDYNENKIMINPVILKQFGHTHFLEGCESCRKGELYYCANVERPYKIEVAYYDIEGNKKKKIFEGFETTPICHEIDHLKGILHIDRVKDYMIFSEEEMREYRKNHPYKILDKDEIYIDGLGEVNEI